MSIELTTEQKAVINHSLGRHARVLAVAGSGKTTTLAHRVKHLLTEQHVLPGAIQVLMFNRLARVQFQQRLDIISPGRHRLSHFRTGPALPGFELILLDVLHVVVELVRCPRANRPSTVHPQLLKIPFPRCNFRNLHVPQALGALPELF